jgi:thiol-disulfide isomerase/thioredoxin
MKYFLPFVFLLSINVPSQDKNKVVEDENLEPMLIGYCTREVFDDSLFAAWFNPEYKSYKPDSATIEMLKDNINDVEITVVMGSWCSDSQVYVPELYKVLDEINYPADDITLIAANEDKKTEGDELEGLGIELVPTIIFYKDSHELGRIVEFPYESIEEDMFGIVSKGDL